MKCSVYILVFAAFAVNLHAEDGGGIGDALGQAASAAAQIGVAAIQSSSDIAVSGIQKQLVEDVAKIHADTEIALSNNNKDISMMQTQATVQLNQMHEAGQTERLAMDLSEKSYVESAQLASEERKRWLEFQLKQQQLAVDYKLEQDKLHEQHLKTLAEEAQAGLISGISYTDSSNKIGVSKGGGLGARLVSSATRSSPMLRTGLKGLGGQFSKGSSIGSVLSSLSLGSTRAKPQKVASANGMTNSVHGLSANWVRHQASGTGGSAPSESHLPSQQHHAVR